MKNDVSHDMGITIFRSSGRIAGNGSQAFRATIFNHMKELPEHNSPPKLLFDFHGVKMMDSTGLGAMMEVGLTIKRKGGRIGVINIGSHTKTLLVVSQLISHFEHFNSENEAILALRKPS